MNELLKGVELLDNGDYKINESELEDEDFKDVYSLFLLIKKDLSNVKSDKYGDLDKSTNIISKEGYELIKWVSNSLLQSCRMLKSLDFEFDNLEREMVKKMGGLALYELDKELERLNNKI